MKNNLRDKIKQDMIDFEIKINEVIDVLKKKREKSTK